MTKTTRRGRSKYPALDPRLNLRTRYDEIADLDYIDKLNDEEKEWMNKFMGEYVNADFRHEKPIHKTQKAKRDCYNRNNARNRDVLTQVKACGKSVNIDDCHESDLTVQSQEDKILLKIDIENQLALKKAKKRLKKSRK